MAQFVGHFQRPKASCEFSDMVQRCSIVTSRHLVTHEHVDTSSRHFHINLSTIGVSHSFIVLIIQETNPFFGLLMED